MVMTKEMVAELNSELSNMGCSFRFEYREQNYFSTMKIVIVNDKFIKSSVLNL